MGFWKTLQKESVFGSFGPYKKHRVLAPSFDFKHPYHFIRWRLSSWYGSCIFVDDFFIRSCDFRWRFRASFCKDTTSGSLFLIFPDSLIFKQPFCKDSIFCHLLVCFIFFVFLLLWPHCLPELLSWCLAFVLSHEYQKNEHERTCTKKTHKIAMNVVTLTTCKRFLAILGQHNTKKKVGASTKSKNCCHGCPKTWTVPYKMTRCW